MATDRPAGFGACVFALCLVGYQTNILIPSPRFTLSRIQVVNALLTQLDALRTHPNTLILTTSNITGAIGRCALQSAPLRRVLPLASSCSFVARAEGEEGEWKGGGGDLASPILRSLAASPFPFWLFPDIAFVDRADIKLFVDLPPLAARYGLLATSLAELARAGIILASESPPSSAASGSAMSADAPALFAPLDETLAHARAAGGVAVTAVAEGGEGARGVGHDEATTARVAHSVQLLAVATACEVSHMDGTRAGVRR